MARAKKGMKKDIESPSGDKAISRSAGSVVGADKAAIIAKNRSNIQSIAKAVASNSISANEVILTIAKATGASVDEMVDKDLVQLLIGLSGDQAKAVGESLELIKTRVLAREEEYTFRIVEIPAGQVEAMTRVSKLNPRDQDWLTEVDVSDLAVTMPKEQAETAYAVRGEDGIIEVFDGSRRRLNAIMMGLPLRVYVTDDTLTVDDFVVYDQTTEAKLGRSQRENGVFWKMLIDTAGYTVESIADKFSFTTKHVENCLKFANIDSRLVGLAYAPSRLGAGNLKKLQEIELLSSMSPDDIESLMEMKSRIVSSDDFSAKDIDLAKKNALIINEILQSVRASNGGKAKADKAEFVQVAKGKLKSQEINKKSNLKSADKGVLTYEIRNYPEKIRKEIERKFDAIVSKHGNFD
ncbi:hypothetical protein LMH73_008250 [Vibrio splendidus]|nr:hypothetical protein [Vibrio splendidus]MCC4880530.1 hypothetical protein [Vibrio splendidus]